MRSRVKVVHIRREDECEITFCGRMTDIDNGTEEPIAVGRDIALYADAETPRGLTSCSACYAAYMDL